MARIQNDCGDQIRPTAHDSHFLDDGGFGDDVGYFTENEQPQIPVSTYEQGEKASIHIYRNRGT